MLSQPSFYDGARPNPETERRAPEMGQSRQARLGCKRKSSGSIMAPIAADSQVCCSLWSVLLLVSTFWPKPDVPCAEQQAPLQFLVPAVPPWCSEWVGSEVHDDWWKGGVWGSGWWGGGFALGGLVVVGGWVSERCRGTEVNGTTPQRLVSVGLPTLALTCISTVTVLTYPC